MSLPEAKTWLHCGPCKPFRTLIDTPQFTTWMMYYCQVSLFQSRTKCNRPQCAAIMDIYGDHLLHGVYLRVVLSANGILECSLKNRIRMSHASLSTLRNAKLTFPGGDHSYAEMVYCTLIESKMDYATFLCPCITDALLAVDCMLQRFFQCCLRI